MFCPATARDASSASAMPRAFGCEWVDILIEAMVTVSHSETILTPALRREFRHRPDSERIRKLLIIPTKSILAERCMRSPLENVTKTSVSAENWPRDHSKVRRKTAYGSTRYGSTTLYAFAGLKSNANHQHLSDFRFSDRWSQFGQSSDFSRGAGVVPFTATGPPFYYIRVLANASLQAPLNW